MAHDERDDHLLRLIAAALSVPVQAFATEIAVELDKAGDLHGTYLLARLIQAFRALPNDDERLEALRIIEERTNRTS